MYFSIDKKFSGFITLIPKTFSWKLDLCLSSFKRNSLLEVQGISFLNWIFKLALRDTRTNIVFDLRCLVASGGADICVSSTSLKKNDVGWPQQPPTERLSDINEKLDFWWSIQQKGTVIGQFGVKNDPTIMISNCFDKMGLSRSLRPLRLLRLLRSLRPLRLLRLSRSLRLQRF